MVEVKKSMPARAHLIADIGTAVMRWQDATQAFDGAVGERLALNSAERRCLSFLFAGPQSASAIADAVGLTRAAVTSLVDRLEERGFVKRHRDQRDRRQVKVAVTDAARKSTMKYYGAIAAQGADLLGGMSDAELRTLKNFFETALALQQRHVSIIRSGAEKPPAGLRMRRA